MKKKKKTERTGKMKSNILNIYWDKISSPT